MLEEEEISKDTSMGILSHAVWMERRGQICLEKERLEGHPVVEGWKDV